jgi:hypothetical protein
MHRKTKVFLILLTLSCEMGFSSSFISFSSVFAEGKFSREPKSDEKFMKFSSLHTFPLQASNINVDIETFFVEIFMRCSFITFKFH